MKKYDYIAATVAGVLIAAGLVAMYLSLFNKVIEGLTSW